MKSTLKTVPPPTEATEFKPGIYNSHDGHFFVLASYLDRDCFKDKKHKDMVSVTLICRNREAQVMSGVVREMLINESVANTTFKMDQDMFLNEFYYCSDYMQITISNGTDSELYDVDDD